jgi:hypothetical protein
MERGCDGVCWGGGLELAFGERAHVHFEGERGLQGRI